MKLIILFTILSIISLSLSSPILTVPSPSPTIPESGPVSLPHHPEVEPEPIQTEHLFIPPRIPVDPPLPFPAQNENLTKRGSPYTMKKQAWIYITEPGITIEYHDGGLFITAYNLSYSEMVEKSEKAPPRIDLIKNSRHSSEDEHKLRFKDNLFIEAESLTFWEDKPGLLGTYMQEEVYDIVLKGTGRWGKHKDKQHNDCKLVLKAKYVNIWLGPGPANFLAPIVAGPPKVKRDTPLEIETWTTDIEASAANIDRPIEKRDDQLLIDPVTTDLENISADTDRSIEKRDDQLLADSTDSYTMKKKEYILIVSNGTNISLPHDWPGSIIFVHVDELVYTDDLKKSKQGEVPPRFADNNIVIEAKKIKLWCEDPKYWRHPTELYTDTVIDQDFVKASLLYGTGKWGPHPDQMSHGEKVKVKADEAHVWIGPGPADFSLWMLPWLRLGKRDTPLEIQTQDAHTETSIVDTAKPIAKREYTPDPLEKDGLWHIDYIQNHYIDLDKESHQKDSMKYHQIFPVPAANSPRLGVNDYQGSAEKRHDRPPHRNTEGLFYDDEENVEKRDDQLLIHPRNPTTVEIRRLAKYLTPHRLDVEKPTNETSPNNSSDGQGRQNSEDPHRLTPHRIEFGPGAAVTNVRLDLEKPFDLSSGTSAGASQKMDAPENMTPTIKGNEKREVDIPVATTSYTPVVTYPPAAQKTEVVEIPDPNDSDDNENDDDDNNKEKLKLCKHFSPTGGQTLGPCNKEDDKNKSQDDYREKLGTQICGPHSVCPKVEEEKEKDRNLVDEDGKNKTEKAVEF